MTSLVVVSHPDPNSLTASVARSVSESIRATGERVETADLSAEGFDPRYTSADLRLFRGTGNTPPDVLAEQERLDDADHVVLVFPMYWWSMPALLKGWIDRVFVSGWAFDTASDGAFEKKLQRLTVHVIPVAGDDADSFARHGIFDAVATQIERGIFEYSGATVGSTSFVHGSDTRSREALAADIAVIGERVAKLVAS